MSSITCPCGVGVYATCCEPLHRGQSFASSAQQLMRSRYSAFAKAEIDYILATTALGQHAALDRQAIIDWSQSNQWLGLEIVSVNEKLDREHAQVEFIAHYRPLQAQATEQAQQHHELSYFVQHKARWYFLDPTLENTLSMKQACLCGANKKYKHCCAPYIT